MSESNTPVTNAVFRDYEECSSIYLGLTLIRHRMAALERAANAMRATLERSLQHHGCDPCHITEALEQFDALKKP